MRQPVSIQNIVPVAVETEAPQEADVRLQKTEIRQVVRIASETELHSGRQRAPREFRVRAVMVKIDFGRHAVCFQQRDDTVEIRFRVDAPLAENSQRMGQYRNSGPAVRFDHAEMELPEFSRRTVWVKMVNSPDQGCRIFTQCGCHDRFALPGDIDFEAGPEPFVAETAAICEEVREPVHRIRFAQPVEKPVETEKSALGEVELPAVFGHVAAREIEHLHQLLFRLEIHIFPAVGVRRVRVAVEPFETVRKPE